MARDMKRELYELNVARKGVYFYDHPERTPVSVVFQERVPFREAYAKLCYLRNMNKCYKKTLIATKKWPIGGALRKFIESGHEIK